MKYTINKININMRAVVLTMLVAICALAMNAQTLTPEMIRNNPDIIYGDGHGDTYTEADRNALANLMSKISVNVSNAVDDSRQEVHQNGDIQNTQITNMSVRTYSQGRLKETRSITVSEKPKFHVMRYITREEVDKMFADRRQKVDITLTEAAKFESKGRIGDALRYYYAAFMLTNTLRDPSKQVFKDAEGEHHLIMWLPEVIQDIMRNIDVAVTEYTDQDATLFFTYKGEPVSQMDFSFLNGISGWTPLNEVKNGMAKIEFRPDFDLETLRVRYEYEYADQARLDPEFKSVIEGSETHYFKYNEVSLADKVKSKKNLVSKEAVKAQQSAMAEVKTSTIDEVDSRKEYDKKMMNVYKALCTNDSNSIKPMFTAEGWDMMRKLLHFGKAKMLSSQKQQFGYYDLGDDRVVCRSLTMSFSFPNNNRTFTEDVTFTFDADKQIEAVSFGLGATANEDIFNHAIAYDGTKIWDDRSVLAIVTFLENYKTAFALRNIDYLEGVFDDNAVIITGTVTKRPKRVDDNGNVYQDNDIVKYNHYSKSEYMDKLRKTFGSQEYVNLRFSDNDVIKMGVGGELYGIQIHQDYFSQSYCDTGYLFLMVDINNPDKPIIKVRTWQPNRDPSLASPNMPITHPDYGLIGPGLF